jgi:hypothetical protein
MPKGKPGSDGAAWASTQRYGKRICESCKWGRDNPKGLRFIDDAFAAKQAGAKFSYPALAAEAKRRFGYPLGYDAMRRHFKEENP